MLDFWNSNMMMSKIFISAFAENKYRNQVDFMLFLDTDTMFLNPIESDILQNQFSVALRPTDYAEASLKLRHDDLKSWEYLLKRFNINEIVKWMTITGLDNVTTYASFNGGFILASVESQLFTKWKEIADLLKDDKEFLEILKIEKTSMHYLDQILLSITLMKYFDTSNVKILNDKYNFSLAPVYYKKIEYSQSGKKYYRELVRELDQFVHIHYHHRFNERTFLKYFRKSSQGDLSKKFIPFEHSAIHPLDVIRRKGIFLTKLIMFSLTRYLKKDQPDIQNPADNQI